MNSRELFLRRVRAAAEQGRPYRVHVQPVDDNVGYLGAGSDLVERFAAEVTAVGGEAIIVDDVAAARLQLGELLRESAAQSAICWQHDVLDCIGLGELLTQNGVVARNYQTLTRMPAE
ncbi:MAG: hypothetical protein JF612_11135 [Planctomycetia bacterium]|nr:hypothetical protein [Planctomycetia bacterium]